MCPYCKALEFNGETVGMCCASGKVKLPQLAAPLEPLKRNHKHNVKTGLRLKEVMPKEIVPRNQSNLKIIAWHSGTAQSMIIAWVDVFKSGQCLKFVPIARPWNSMVKQWECVAPQEKLNFLYWLHHQSHWRLSLLELRQNLSVFCQKSDNTTHVSKWRRLEPKPKIQINLCLLSK